MYWGRVEQRCRRDQRLLYTTQNGAEHTQEGSSGICSVLERPPGVGWEAYGQEKEASSQVWEA